VFCLKGRVLTGVENIIAKVASTLGGKVLEDNDSIAQSSECAFTDHYNLEIEDISFLNKIDQVK